MFCFPSFTSIYFPPAKVAPFFLFPNFLYIISKFFIHYFHLSGHCSLIYDLIISIYFHRSVPFLPDHPLFFLTTLFSLHHTHSLHTFYSFYPLSTHYTHLSPTHSFTLLLLLFFYSFSILPFYSFSTNLSPTSFTLFLFLSPFTPILVGNFSLTPTCNDFLLFWWSISALPHSH